MQSGNFLNGAFGRSGVACGSGYLEVLLSVLGGISWVCWDHFGSSGGEGKSGSQFVRIFLYIAL